MSGLKTSINTGKTISLLLIVFSFLPSSCLAFFGSLVLLGPMIATSIFTSQTADNTKKIKQEMEYANIQLGQVLTALQNGLSEDIVKKITNTIYGKDKLSGAQWSFYEGTNQYTIVEMNLSPTITTLKSHYQSASNVRPTAFNPGTLLFHEELGLGAGEMTLNNVESDPSNNVPLKVGTLRYLANMKTNLLDPLDRDSRFKEYIEKIDDTITLKSSIDFNNLLLLENLIQNKFALEVSVLGELIDTYESVNAVTTKRNVEASLGELDLLTITP